MTMRIVAGIVISAVVGVALAVTASYALATSNAPDREVEDAITTGNLRAGVVVEYGTR
ncbi:DUF2613 family protein [Spirilliplanes yamanashiensis]|uniref:Uncharacterized protein n=1 Tax=Spirilliplanes yamanashiensis TaxID=42233 RepID=A0A8J4DI64_9ACTN|nr:DUF2613 family protein [Spirilliplanes yamanashiensis]MDP9814416.1 hypothetical protein [Spirilliplanes yamanashiensis]GIJ02069.1 hypothetical protein Sya03_14210 [Spirilliplanes yamanashiensis]